MANIAIIGYGQMGKFIEQIAKERGHDVSVIVDPQCDTTKKEINEEDFKDVDVCIDFTHPDCAIPNIKKLAAMKKNLVMGTTGWYDKMDEVRKTVEESGIGFMWSGNFSLGVNLFFRIIRQASKIMNKTDQYDPYSVEFHHNKKADSPSGTARMISDIMLNELDSKSKIVTQALDRRIEPNELHVASVRGGSIPGTHIVGFDSVFDNIELKHTARTRQGFALGAVLAAEFLVGKSGFFSIDDLMKEIIGGE